MKPKSLPLVEVEYVSRKKIGECKNMVIDNLIYNVYMESGEVYKNNVYVGEYDKETEKIKPHVVL
jgi:hypothetical protein